MPRRDLRSLLLALLATSAGCSADVWLTPDQQGRLHFERADYATAAQRFDDPLWRGTAFYLDGRYEAAITEFARLETARAWFNRGNARAHRGEWELAAEAYETCLERDPEHPGAAENLALARLHIPWRPGDDAGGDMGTTGLDARPDEIAFDADAERLEASGREMELEGSVLSDEQIADMWLRQIDPSPARFLARKFAVQLARAEAE